MTANSLLKPLLGSPTHISKVTWTYLGGKSGPIPACSPLHLSNSRLKPSICSRSIHGGVILNSFLLLTFHFEYIMKPSGLRPPLTKVSRHLVWLIWIPCYASPWFCPCPLVTCDRVASDPVIGMADACPSTLQHSPGVLVSLRAYANPFQWPKRIKNEPLITFWYDLL